ncbi:N(G),N(G)-dimethylarginine dimethylaminohydrolase 1-like isoform X1 [Haliotis rubra]|uniref:N(G),N(G)-dimethylarginine dimethylaminohydrolase 1-like isoform X1 n=1 Tax=Haliotis rubra TaxID=36100 RepID=UPI001EE58C2C|nr:N(G),N(G)-dimethylarginine dimethylaminohydrolase 1-like isoform X1 [Haliotis rubra]
MAAFHYNYAIVSRIPNSFKDKAITKDHCQIDLEKARAEYRNLLTVLQSCDINLIELQEDEKYPDCCFVEDTAVVIGGTALITRPGHPSRQGEVGEIRRVLKNDLHFNVIEMKVADAKLDGGDVLFTGKEIFVGVGKRTNEAGAGAVALAFIDYDVSPINIGDTDVLHLKDAINVIGRNELVVAGGDGPRTIMKRMDCLKTYNCKILQMPSPLGADMLYMNGRLIHRTNEELTKEGYGLLDEKLQCTRHQLHLGELTKAYGTISSLCILLRINRRQQKVLSNVTDPDLTQFLSIGQQKS